MVLTRRRKFRLAIDSDQEQPVTPGLNARRGLPQPINGRRRHDRPHNQTPSRHLTDPIPSLSAPFASDGPTRPVKSFMMTQHVLDLPRSTAIDNATFSAIVPPPEQHTAAVHGRALVDIGSVSNADLTSMAAHHVTADGATLIVLPAERLSLYKGNGEHHFNMRFSVGCYRYAGSTGCEEADFAVMVARLIYAGVLESLAKGDFPSGPPEIASTAQQVGQAAYAPET